MLAFLFISIALCVLEWIYIRIARKCRIVDVPCGRSSHAGVVVRGGGIVFYFAAVGWFLWQGCTQWWLIAGLTLLAAVSFADDLREMPVSWRLCAQLLGAAAIFYASAQIPLGVGVWIAAIILSAGLINSFNFMDGINGMAGLYCLVIFLAFVWIDVSLLPGYVDIRLPLLMIVASLIFCFYNFRRQAVCFAGDVGSIVAGAVVFFILCRLVISTGNIGWLMLVAVYGVDTVLTLCRRLVLGKNIFRAHRMHAYQLLSNELGFPQPAVSSVVCAVQAFIDVLAIGFGLCNAWWLAATLIILSSAYFLIVYTARCQK